jgi:hypothetical protein
MASHGQQTVASIPGTVLYLYLPRRDSVDKEADQQMHLSPLLLITEANWILP